MRAAGKPPTLEQWREWSRTASRNWTDAPIGAHTYARRKVDARGSRLIAVHGPPPRPRHRQEAVA